MVLAVINNSTEPFNSGIVHVKVPSSLFGLNEYSISSPTTLALTNSKPSGRLSVTTTFVAAISLVLFTAIVKVTTVSFKTTVTSAVVNS